MDRGAKRPPEEAQEVVGNGSGSTDGRSRQKPTEEAGPSLQHETPRRLPNEDALLRGLDSRERARAVDRIACRMLEHVTGITQVPSYDTTGPLPAERLEALALVASEVTANRIEELPSLELGPRLATEIAVQLADLAELLHGRESAKRTGKAGPEEQPRSRR